MSKLFAVNQASWLVCGSKNRSRTDKMAHWLRYGIVGMSFVINETNAAGKAVA